MEFIKQQSYQTPDFLPKDLDISPLDTLLYRIVSG